MGRSRPHRAKKSRATTVAPAHYLKQTKPERHSEHADAFSLKLPISLHKSYLFNSRSSSSDSSTAIATASWLLLVTSLLLLLRSL